MTEFSWRTRREALARLQSETFDILIIGGGITGAGLALDAAARGLKVALVEKRDFAAGTSSRSTKLIHGGLRYLEHFDFALVREGLRERALLMKLAPHLAEPFPFLIPIYAQSERNYDAPLKMRAGLWLYDFLAGGYRIGRHRRVSREEALKLAPQLDAAGLRGAFIYYDGLTNDSRLVIAVLKTAHERGATIVNHTEAFGFITDENQKLAGARLRDLVTGEEIETRAKLIINATGVWMDEVSDLDTAKGGADRHRVRPSKGIHLTVAAERLRVKAACLIPALTGHRFYFVVPWEGRVNIGTTDIDYREDKDAPHAEAGEENAILAAINSYFPEAQLQPSDVISSWAGLRPLITDSEAKATTDVSRREIVTESHSGLISIAGGKLTTYRLMAERGIDLAARRLNERFGIKAKHESRTAGIRLSGAVNRDEVETIAQQIATNSSLAIETARHLVRTYGGEAHCVAGLAREDWRLQLLLLPDLPNIAAEIVYAARQEMAITLADALARRTRLIMLAGAEALTCAPVAAEFMAQELGWDGGEIEEQITGFTREYEQEYTI